MMNSSYNQTVLSVLIFSPLVAAAVTLLDPAGKPAPLVDACVYLRGGSLFAPALFSI